MNSIESWKKPTPEQIDKTIVLLSHLQQREYFFNHLNNPLWIEPLRQKGFFKHPPLIIKEESTISFPLWAESRYLARMAEYVPSEVLDLALEIDTDNPRVHADLVEAALKMPPELAVKLTDKVKEWIELPYSSDIVLLENTSSFCVHLAKGNKQQIRRAFNLLHTLLATSVDFNNQSHQIYRSLREVRSRYDYWVYELIVQKSISELVNISSEIRIKTFKTLGHILCKFIGLILGNIDIENEENKLDKLYEDRSTYSSYWSYFSNSTLNILAVSVKEIAEKIIENEPNKINEIILQLHEWRWRVFHRIALDLLYKFPKLNFQIVISELTNAKHFFDPYSQEREYIILLKEHFADLPEEAREIILDNVENPSFKKSQVDNIEELERFFKHWQLKRLTPLKDSLPKRWRERYETLVEEFGVIEFNNLLSRYSIDVGIGSPSPKNVSELASLTNEDLIEYLKNWEPNEQSSFEPSSEGLGTVLGKVAEQDPERFALIAEQFKEVRPRYGCKVIRGLSTAIRNRKTQEGELSQISWRPILELCSWIMRESEPFREREARDLDRFSEWGEPRRAVADILEVGLSNENQLQIPFDLRNEVWELLKILVRDPEPTLEHENRYGGSNMNPSTLSINTVRGKAFHVVIRYALWVRRFFESLENGQQIVERRFDEIPEVRDVLDAYLDPVREPSATIRSVYGQWLPQLTLLDRDWVEDRITKIFPREPLLSHLRQVAWDSYILYCSLYNDVFEVLRLEYLHAIDRLDKDRVGEREIMETEQNLSYHLMTLYWSGKLDLDEPGGLLARFYEKAPDALRGHALGFVGRSLKNTIEMIHAEILDDLKSLWEIRLDTAKRSIEQGDFLHEVAAFARWFNSGKFNDTWALEQLKQVLEINNFLEHDFLVIEKLATLSGEMPDLTFECLELILADDRNGWQAYRWLDETEIILSNALRGNNREKAIDLINKLGEKGNWEFRKLL